MKKVLCICVIVLVLIFSYLFYLKKDTNANINLDEIKTVIDKNYYFGNELKDLTIDDVSLMFGINSDDIEKCIGKRSVLSTTSSMYVIVEAKSENSDKIYSIINEYGYKYEEKWKNYLASEYFIVSQRKVGKIKNYIYFIVSDYSDEIVDIIK